MTSIGRPAKPDLTHPAELHGFDRDLSSAEPLNAVAIVNAVLRQRQRILTAALVAAVVVVAWKLTRPRMYASEALFSVQASEQRSPFSGIAAQFGVALPTQQGEQSAAYYVELMKSRPILETVHRTPIVVGTDTISVADAFDIRVTDTLQRQDQTVRRLSRAIAANRSRETGIVTVQLAARSAPVAQQILRAVVLQLNDFNLRTRQSRAANERQFIEERLATIRQELEQAESRLENFLQRNRTYASSPELSFQHERLNRDVYLRQQLYTGLAQNFEQARIDEVRDTPALTIISEPNYPLRPQARGTLSALIVTGFGTVLAGVLLSVVALLCVPRDKSLADDLVEYDRHREQLKGQLRRPWRLLGTGVARA